MTQEQIPETFMPFSRLTVRAMLWLNGFAHLVISLALAASVVMFTLLFFKDVLSAIHSSNIVHGFVHALGTLMLLWSISALIVAEIRYLMGSKLLVVTFVEVVLVLFLRKLIVMPVQDATPSLQEIGMWVGCAFVMSVVYALILWARRSD